MSHDQDDFYRIGKLPPYVFSVINEMKAKARAAQMDVVDLGMGNPDGCTPQVVVDKLVEAAANPRNHGYSVSRGIPHLREEIVKRYLANYGVTLDAEKEAIVTIGAKDALAHLLFATVQNIQSCSEIRVDLFVQNPFLLVFVCVWVQGITVFREEEIHGIFGPESKYDLEENL